VGEDMSFVDTANDFKRREKDFRKQEIRPTTYSVRPDLFQIDSYASDENRADGHANQTIQFDITGLKELKSVIEKEYPSLSTDKEIYVDSDKEDYSIEELAKILSDNYTNAEEGMRVCVIHLFGIRFGKIIKKNNYSLSRIISLAGMNDSYSTELNKGLKLYESIDLNKYGLSFGKNEKESIKTESSEQDLFITNPAKKFDASEFINSLSLAGQYINSLLAKPFVILTGNSGTGKTRIAKRFAEYLKKENDAGKTNFLLVPVGADWTDNTKILGYYNPIANNGEGKYVKTEIFEFMERADANPEIPFFLILDEMNLSHVERYFSDFLSRMETPDSAFEIDNYKDGNLQFPGNLFITGTVNIDETTYMFSPKVLDRANVIEFKPEMDSVLGNLMDDSADVPEEEAPDGMAEGFMKLSLEIRKGRVTEELKENMKTAEKILAGFYPVLEKCGFEFAYRTVKEIRQYIVAAYKTCGDPASFKIDSTMDEQILQKVLPKIHGNKRQIGPMLDELERLCIEKDTADQDVTGTGWNLLLSLKKIRWMKDRLEKFQYVSFI
jgi:MoxR-like ATPase